MRRTLCRGPFERCVFGEANVTGRRIIQHWEANLLSFQRPCEADPRAMFVANPFQHSCSSQMGISILILIGTTTDSVTVFEAGVLLQICFC